MSWKFDDKQPIYRQLIQQIRVMIASGVYQPNERMPSVRELALEAGVNPNTMQRALSELEKQGLMYSQRTSGRFVTDDKEALMELRKKLAADYIEQLCERLAGLGMDRGEIIEAVTQWRKGEES